ncbi:NAD(P)-binding protein [Lactifluus subvellereus]|nr:NAD(P)-binding protein [Lactifluus subvellereus]
MHGRPFASWARWSSTDAQMPSRILPSFSLEGKVCLVTGAARGLGNEFCRAFMRSGCTSLALLDLKQSEVKTAAEELTEFAGTEHLRPDALKIVGLECDVSSEVSVCKAFTRTLEVFGRVDAVVASAGIVENYSALDYPSDRMKRLYDINVHGAFFTAREAAKYMIPQGGGSIILVASMSANIINIPQLQTPYNASKAAVKHMASSLAIEWAKKGVRVNALRHDPGYMMTKLTRTILSNNPELKKTWESLTPLGRMGEPEELDGAIVFLASDASRFMTGSEVRIDGGYCST